MQTDLLQTTKTGSPNANSRDYFGIWLFIAICTAVVVAQVFFALVWELSGSPGLIVGSGILGVPATLSGSMSLLVWFMHRQRSEAAKYPRAVMTAAIAGAISYVTIAGYAMQSPAVSQTELGTAYVEQVAFASAIGSRFNRDPWPIDEAHLRTREYKDVAIKIDHARATDWRNKSICLKAILVTHRLGVLVVETTPVFARPHVAGEWLVGNPDRQECLGRQVKPPASSPAGPRFR